MPIDVLIIEDNPADVRLIREVFQNLDQPCNLTVVPTGEQGIEALHRGAFKFVIVDLMLPGADGCDVVRFIKSAPSIKNTITIVLTGIASPAAIQRAYDAGANCCLIKPHDFDELQLLLTSTIKFWTKIARPCPKDPGQERGETGRLATHSA